MLLSLNVKSYYTYWTECPVSKRDELFDDTKTWQTNYMGEDQEYSSKRLILLLCINDALIAQKEYIIDEIYNFLLSKGIDCNMEHYPAIIYWIKENMLNGYFTDNYTIWVDLASYYWGNNNYSKALQVIEQEFQIHEQIIDDYLSRHDKSREATIESFYFAIILHQIILTDAGLFDDSRNFQKTCISRGYIENTAEKQEKRVIANIWFRLEKELQFHKDNDTIMPNIDDIVTLEQMGKNEFAATGYKKLADLYYNAKDYKTAIFFYEKALSLWPIVYAARTKLKWAQNKLIALNKD